MQKKLYWKLGRPSLRYAYFAFFDVPSYLADPLFIRHEVEVFFDKEFQKPGTPYLTILCHVRKKDIHEFLAALEDLKRSMRICGYPNYEEEVGQMMREMEALRGELKHGKNDATVKTEQTETA